MKPGFTSPLTEAHPRSRGENDVKTGSGLPVLGSSPLTRGKPWFSGHPGRGRRAHPRSRGENPSRRSTTSPPMGSSPLTRGKPDGLDGASAIRGLIPAHAGKTKPTPESKSRPGLIPAHAGKTPSRPSRTSPTRAHPRSRGENWVVGADDRGQHGSSPLTRGKHRRYQRGR